MIGARLRAARQAAQLTQTELARAINSRQGYIAQLELGERRPSMEMIQALARKLGVSSAYLMGEDTQDASMEYPNDPRVTILGDRDAAPGLREMAQDDTLAQVLAIRPDEWASLRSLAVPSPPSKDGYVALLCFLRVVCAG